MRSIYSRWVSAGCPTLGHLRGVFGCKGYRFAGTSEAADGTRTHDLLHGKQYLNLRFQACMRVSRVITCDPIASDYREFWYRRGTGLRRPGIAITSGFGQSLDSQTRSAVSASERVSHGRSTERNKHMLSLLRGARKSSQAGTSGSRPLPGPNAHLACPPAGSHGGVPLLWKRSSGETSTR